MTRAIAAVALGLAVFCCGPKPKPAVVDPDIAEACPDQTCEHDEFGDFNCECHPEE